MSSPDPATTEWVPIWNMTPATTPPAIHAPSHAVGGADPVAVTGLAGYPGGTTLFLRADGTFAAPPGTTPVAHATTHNTGGSDPLTALSAAILTTGALPFARVQLGASPRLLGRGTAAAGAMEEITLGAGLTMTATTLSVTATAPAAHATTHQPGGADAMAVDALAATGSLRTLGTGATQAAPGNDARFTDARVPTAHATTHKAGGSDVIKLDELAAATDVTTLNASTTAHGLLLKLSGSATQFLSGAGTWVTPAAGDEVWIGTADPGAAYELWFDTDEPGVDPTISPHHLTHEAGGADEIVNINAARVTSGTLADARLSTNVPLKNASNVFTKNYAIGAHAISIQAQNPTMSLIETAAPADARMWRFIAYGQLFYIMSTNDAETANLGALVMDRSGGLTCGRVINMQGPTPFLALTDMNQAVDLRAFIIQNSGGTLAFTSFNDAFTSAGWTNIRLNRNGDTLVCPSQSGSRLQFGGATSGQPALRWSGTNLECVLADNSNWAGFRCATLDVYSTATIAGGLNANGGISCFQTITLKDGANPSCYISQNANYLRIVTSNYGQVTYMDTAGNWSLSGAMTPAGGIQFASTPASASATNLDTYQEVNWTPTFRCSGGGVPTYSIQHGLAVKIGRFVHFGGRCSISSKGSMATGGWVALDGLPWVTEGTYWGGGIYAGYIVGATGTISAGVGGYTPPGGQYVQLTINSTAGIALLAPDWILGSFDMIFFGSYFANS